MSRKTKKENRNSLALRHGHSEMTEARQRGETKRLAGDRDEHRGSRLTETRL